MVFLVFKLFEILTIHLVYTVRLKQYFRKQIFFILSKTLGCMESIYTKLNTKIVDSIDA